MPARRKTVLKASFVEMGEGGDLKASMFFDGPGYIHLECIAMLVNQLSKNCGVPAQDVLKDLKGLI